MEWISCLLGPSLLVFLWWVCRELIADARFCREHIAKLIAALEEGEKEWDDTKQYDWTITEHRSSTSDNANSPAE